MSTSPTPLGAHFGHVVSEQVASTFEFAKLEPNYCENVVVVNETTWPANSFSSYKFSDLVVDVKSEEPIECNPHHHHQAFDRDVVDDLMSLASSSTMTNSATSPHCDSIVSPVRDELSDYINTIDNFVIEFDSSVLENILNEQESQFNNSSTFNLVVTN